MIASVSEEGLYESVSYPMNFTLKLHCFPSLSFWFWLMGSKKIETHFYIFSMFFPRICQRVYAFVVNVYFCTTLMVGLGVFLWKLLEILALIRRKESSIWCARYYSSNPGELHTGCLQLFECALIIDKSSAKWEGLSTSPVQSLGMCILSVSYWDDIME